VKCIGCREREAIESEWNSSMCDDCLVAVKSARKKMEAGMSPADLGQQELECAMSWMENLVGSAILGSTLMNVGARGAIGAVSFIEEGSIERSWRREALGK